MAEEENKNAEASGPYLRLSRTQVTGVLVGMAAAVVIGGLGMILQRLAYRVPSVERAASPVLGEGESVGAEYASAAGSQRPFLVEVLDANNRRWLLWFDDSSSKNVPTQAAYKSSLPFSTPSLRGPSSLKQTAASPKPSEPRKFTLVVPQASRPQANSSATNFPSLLAPVVRDELQPPLQAPIVDILSGPAIPAIPSPISESESCWRERYFGCADRCDRERHGIKSDIGPCGAAASGHGCSKTLEIRTCPVEWAARCATPGRDGKVPLRVVRLRRPPVRESHARSTNLLRGPPVRFQRGSGTRDSAIPEFHHRGVIKVFSRCAFDVVVGFACRRSGG